MLDFIYLGFELVEMHSYSIEGRMEVSADLTKAMVELEIEKPVIDEKLNGERRRHV